MAAREYVECGLAVVHPWLCDAMGHLTTRHFLGMFDDAAYQLFMTFGYDPVVAAEEKWGWADVRHEIDYRAELVAGAVVRIDGRVSALGRSWVQTEYRLFDRATGVLSAQLSGRTVCLDLAARKSRPLPPSISREVEELFGVTFPQVP
jgi:acyl-CoA thioester hydrolase